jgi:MucB/RseB N-terminal domain
MPKLSLYAPHRLAFTTLLPLLVVVTTFEAVGVAAESRPCAGCIGFVVTPGQVALLFDLSESLRGTEVLVRASLPGQGLEAAADSTSLSLIDIMETIRSHGGRPGVIWPDADTIPGSDVLALASRIAVDATRLPVSSESAFLLKRRMTGLRAARDGLLLGIVGAEDQVDSLQREIAPYIDFVARKGATPPPYPARGELQFFEVIAPGAGPASQPNAMSVQRWLIELPADADNARRLLTDTARAVPFLKEGLIAGGIAEVHCDGVAAATYLDPESLDTVAVARDCRTQTIAATPDVPNIERVTLSNGDVLIRVPAIEGRFAEEVRVVGARALGVREIIARHQAASARQNRAVQRLISTGTMTLTFEAPGFPAPMTITSDTVMFAEPGRTEIEQRDVRINGVQFRRDSVPRLPLLEPERVASPPLAIALTDVYRYRLEGREEIAGRSCYVVSFQPTDSSRSLFSGRAWIDATNFGMARVSAVQTGLRGAIVSSEQTDEFRNESDAIWLLAKSDIRQIYEGAGHRTPIHRVLTIAQHDINPPDFDRRRAAAYASTSVMLRDTPEGYRYLRRDRTDDANSTRVEPIVAPRANRVRTVAVGVIIDPNISQPLPFAGLSYVDFNLFGSGTQLNGFFGGTYGQVAVSVPSVGGSRWQLAGRAFGIASSYNDRAFIEGREIYEANISQRPAHASAWVLHPLTSHITARAGYEFDYIHFGPASSTAETFIVPASQAAHAVRLGIDGQAHGWTGSIWWSGARRVGWREWGEANPARMFERYEPRQRDHQRMGAMLSRSFVASPRLVGHIEAAWMTGRDLDRFSRYSFGSFDNRLRGYPSALIRYDRGAVLRSSIAWSAGRLVRIDGFLDSAYVHDPAFGHHSKPYTGVGAAAEFPAPFGTLVAVEWGYGFQGINSDGSRGTQVVRISGYKMF